MGKGVTASLINQDEFRKLFRLDDRNDVVIIAQGRHLRHYEWSTDLGFYRRRRLGIYRPVCLGCNCTLASRAVNEFKDIRV
ncbi:MAG: hypothetical protein R3C56_24430 [Pirellulaceae bacterium]